MREWLQISMAKPQMAFVKANSDDEVRKVQGLGGDGGELSHPFHKWVEELGSIEGIEVRAGRCPPNLFDEENLTSVQDDDDRRPSNQFGRGQRMSSVSTGRRGGIGWRPKPHQRLLGGAGKKVGPKTQSRKSADGMYNNIFIYKSDRQNKWFLNFYVFAYRFD